MPGVELKDVALNWMEGPNVWPEDTVVVLVVLTTVWAMVF